jgi:hypothetical protein
VKESKEARETRIARLKEHQWPKGQSANPGGRPKGSLSWAKVLRDVGYEINPKDKQGRTYMESAARMMWHKAGNEGSVRAAEMIADRLEGKPLQAIAVSGSLETIAREERVAQVLDRLAALKEGDDQYPIN